VRQGTGDSRASFERYSAYDLLADVYGAHWGHFLAGQIGPVLDRLVLSVMPDGAAILDLCCGTGDLAAALSERGFLFDLNTELAFLERWDDDFGFVEDDHAVVVRVTYDPAARIGRFDATVFREEPQARGRWRRSDVMLLQRPYEAEAVCAALVEAGFTDVRALDAEQELALEGHVGRVFYLARRPITARPH
jgi:SAM-dependent methyltransferase